MIRYPVLVLVSVLAAGSLQAQTTAQARESLQAGQYKDAARAFRTILENDPSSYDVRRDLIRALLSTGEYDASELLAREAPAPGAFANTLGEILVIRGKLEEAATAFQESIDANARDALTAEVNLAELLFSRGEIDEAMTRFDRFIDIYNASNGRLTATELVAVGRAVRYLGRTNPDLFQDALRAFDEATTIAPTWHEPRVRAGELFLETYSSTDAQSEFEKVLGVNPRHPGALLGLAKALEFDGTSDAGKVLGQLLEINSNHLEARALLANQHLTRERYQDAYEQAEMALAVNPNSLVALTALAGTHLLRGDLEKFQEVRARVLKLNPRYSGLDAKLAELAVQTRRYGDAVIRAEAAVELDPHSWTAWGLLGMNELRLGDVEQGRTHLMRAFEGDPYNPWFKNNLDLLDTFERFEIHETDHFELFLHGTESDLLATYLAPIAEEAYESLTRRYGSEPLLPVRAELFPSHADFSVRTLGETGLGALGVSFGRVLVMDSPGARERGDYNWASVFWHELSHTFHLAISDNRVPRWFSEGLAVHEQRKARQGWGHQVTIPFLRALADGNLKKVSELNDGFMRPDYPQQVIFSYYQSSLVFEVIEDRYGFATIRKMLEGYKRGETTAELFESLLSINLEDFDQEFEEFLQDRFRIPLNGLAEIGEAPLSGSDITELEDWANLHPGDFIARLRLGAALVGEERYTEAQPHLEAARKIFPNYGGPDSPYWYLAQAYNGVGDLTGAEQALSQLIQRSESNYDAYTMHADVLEQLDRPKEAADALDKAVLVWPYEIELHQRLATLHAEVGNYPLASRERAAVVALNPTDKAQALYALAIAYQEAGDLTGARSAVLQALEIAPNFDAALELLLILRSGLLGES
jgi:tetratricopeptide (TPR) repeat protein